MNKLREKILADDFARRRRLQKPENPYMTIAIGMICNKQNSSDQRIIVAADSQTTYERQKDLDANKLFAMKFSNADVLVVQSGFVIPSQKVIGHMRRHAMGKTIKDVSTVEQWAQTSVRDARNELMETFRDIHDDRQRYLQFKLSNDCEFLIAFFFNGEPFLRQIDIERCVAAKPRGGRYEAIGIGNELAMFILKEYQSADPAFESGDPIAIDVIRKVKATVPDCSGPTKMAIVAASSAHERECEVFRLPNRVIEIMETRLAESEEHCLPERKQQLLAILNTGFEISDAEWEAMHKESDAF